MAKEVTVAELAEDLNVSKQLIYYHAKKISKDFQIRNQSNQLVFNPEQVSIIKGFISKNDDNDSNEYSNVKTYFNKKEDSKKFKNVFKDDSFESQFSNESVKALMESNEEHIKTLKDILNKKDERIDTLLSQLSYSQKLIDQQQQLTLSLQTKIEYLTDDESNIVNKNERWWHKLFK